MRQWMAGEIMQSIIRFLEIRSSLLSARKAAIVSAFAALGLAGAARGAELNGGLTDSPIGTGSATPSSLTLAGSNIMFVATGDFLTLGAESSDLTSSTATVSGLSTTPTAEAISDYFEFATPDAVFGGTGTTPPNRFDFELTSLTETAYDGAPTFVSSFSGAGIITDTDGVYDPTPATFTLGFSGPGSYGFSLDTVVPEPTTLGLAAISLGALGMRRRRA
jgi:PEP-CTERM motif